MKRIILYPYKMGSKGAIMVQGHLTEQNFECLRVYSDRDYAPRQWDVVIGWGSGHPAAWDGAGKRVGCTYLNRPENICKAVNKLDTFEAMLDADVSVPEFTTSKQTAKQWQKRGCSVMVRADLEGMDGSGAVVVGPKEDLPEARLYTLLMKATEEYRVHVFSGKPIYFQRRVPVKQLLSDTIKTTSNGWGFTHLSEHETPKPCVDESIKAVASLGLDFGCTDVVYLANGSAYVLEVNTAPELGPLGSKAYAEAIKAVAA